MSYKKSKQEQGFRIICSCYHAGFSKTDIEKHLNKSVSKAYIEKVLEWEQEQIIQRDEIGALYDALIQTRKLKKQANQILQNNYNSIHASPDTNIKLIKQISELIKDELEYTNRINTLSKQSDPDSKYDDIASLPDWILSLENSECDDNTEETSENEHNNPEIPTTL